MSLASTDPLARSPLRVWLRSEHLDGQNYLRTGSTYPAYDGASWPLGLALSRDPSGVDNFTLIDASFDHDAKIAFRLPWQYTKVGIEVPLRRGQENFSIDNVGHWDGAPIEFERVIAPLVNRELASSEGETKIAFALTPFCIIAQRCVIPNGADQARIVDSYIAFFYTFETFIQESLALDAHRRGVAAHSIIRGYEHLYSNAQPPDVIPRDLAKSRIATLAQPPFSLDGIIATAETAAHRTTIGGLPEIRARSARQTQFHCRRQTHLMVGIAAALRGLPSFAERRSPSPLVRATREVPTVDMLAPFWLAHLFGSYDHAAECERLLLSLASSYGNDITREVRGLRMPEFTSPRSAAELAVALAMPPMYGGRDEPTGDDFFRWSWFESGLDDQSILGWQERVARFVANGGG